MLRTFTCNLCEAMCGLHLRVEDGRIEEIRGNPGDVFSRGHICPKGPALREVLEDPDRLRQPMRRTAGGFVPVPWDEALDEAAARLREIQRRHGRDAVAFYYGNPIAHSHHAALGMQLLTFALRTHNRFDPNSQDSNPKLFACFQMYGDAASLTIPDVDRTDFLLMLGANPAITGGSLMALGDVRGRLQGIRRRGGRMVLLDPRRNETAAWCDEHHFLRPGSDAALLFALLHVLFEERRVGERALAVVASGADRLRSLARKFAPERVAERTGLRAESIRALARELSQARRSVIYGRTGTAQNEFGPLATWLLEAINVVTGNFDREGGAMFAEPAADPVPLARLLIGNVYDRWRSRVRGLPEFLGSLPSAVMAEEMESEGPGRIRAFVCLAGNPVLSTPNGARLERALRGLEFRVSIDYYLNETSRLADLVLPPAHALEVGNFDLILLPTAVRNFVKASTPAVQRSPGARDDWEILSELSLRLAAPRWLRAPLRRLMLDLPDRLVDRLLRRRQLSLAKLHEAPDGIDLGPLRPARASKLRTPDGRVQLCPDVFAADVPRLERWLDAPPPALSLIGRRDLRTNNSWMHNAPSLAKGPDRARLWMHPLDVAACGLRDGGIARVESRTGALCVNVRATEDVMPGVVSLPHGFGHAAARDSMKVAGALPGENVNALTDEERVEPVLGTSALNGVPVRVRPG
jgi:anaerobic selenocysteine-containing dehydrogenase